MTSTEPDARTAPAQAKKIARELAKEKATLSVEIALLAEKIRLLRDERKQRQAELDAILVSEENGDLKTARALIEEIDRLGNTVNTVREEGKALRVDRDKRELQIREVVLQAQQGTLFAPETPGGVVIDADHIALLDKPCRTRYERLVGQHGEEKVLAAIVRAAGIDALPDEPLRVGLSILATVEAALAAKES